MTHSGGARRVILASTAGFVFGFFLAGFGWWALAYDSGHRSHGSSGEWLGNLQMMVYLLGAGAALNVIVFVAVTTFSRSWQTQKPWTAAVRSAALAVLANIVVVTGLSTWPAQLFGESLGVLVAIAMPFGMPGLMTGLLGTAWARRFVLERVTPRPTHR